MTVNKTLTMLIVFILFAFSLFSSLVVEAAPPPSSALDDDFYLPIYERKTTASNSNSSPLPEYSSLPPKILTSTTDDLVYAVKEKNLSNSTTTSTIVASDATNHALDSLSGYEATENYPESTHSSISVATTNQTPTYLSRYEVTEELLDSTSASNLPSTSSDYELTTEKHLPTSLSTLSGKYNSSPEHCPHHEVWSECSPICEPKCDNPQPRCEKICKEPGGCTCKRGLFRKSNGKCVKPHKCPPMTCDSNEIATSCKPCEGNCDRLRVFCPQNSYDHCKDNRGPFCKCKRGYIRFKHGGACVPLMECLIDYDSPPNPHHKGDKNNRPVIVVHEHPNKNKTQKSDDGAANEGKGKLHSPPEQSNNDRFGTERENEREHESADNDRVKNPINKIKCKEPPCLEEEDSVSNAWPNDKLVHVTEPPKKYVPYEPLENPEPKPAKESGNEKKKGPGNEGNIDNADAEPGEYGKGKEEQGENHPKYNGEQEIKQTVDNYTTHGVKKDDGDDDKDDNGKKNEYEPEKVFIHPKDHKNNEDENAKDDKKSEPNKKVEEKDDDENDSRDKLSEYSIPDQYKIVKLMKFA